MKLKHKQFGFKADTVGDDGTFTGYGSVFGNVDLGGEIVVPGAFTESLKAIKSSGDPLPMLWQHNPSQPIGGYDLLVEDDKGLKASGWMLVQEIPLAAQVHALMKRRVVKGLSIGYYEEETSYNEKTGVLSLLKLELREISPVTFPMNVEAQVDSVKSIVVAMRKSGELPTKREFEGFLRESGFSVKHAVALASRAYADSSSRDSGGEKSVKAILESFHL